MRDSGLTSLSYPASHFLAFLASAIIVIAAAYIFGANVAKTEGGHSNLSQKAIYYVEIYVFIQNFKYMYNS